MSSFKGKCIKIINFLISGLFLEILENQGISGVRHDLLGSYRGLSHSYISVHGWSECDIHHFRLGQSQDPPV